MAHAGRHGCPVSAVNDAMGSADLFRQGGVEFLCDAWLAAEFGRHRQCSFVRLVPEREQWPDFEAKTGGDIERVECAETDIRGRRRGDEYREAPERAADGPLAIEHDPIEDWIARADQVPAALSAVIGTKIGKLYAGRASLLVYLNIPASSNRNRHGDGNHARPAPFSTRVGSLESPPLWAMGRRTASSAISINQIITR